jgi:uncharacterized protein YqhQ
MEGVMMRGKKTVVTAVRNPKGQIVTHSEVLAPLYSGPLRRIPFVRGVIVMIESMVLGIKSLMFSANISLEEEEEKVSGGLVTLMLFVGIAMAVTLFFVVPLLLTKLLRIESSILFNIVDGFLRVVIFMLYLRVMGLMKDMRRVFAYHGAEHKVVNAYESGTPLETDAVRRYGTAHVRCGTSFLFTVVMISILVFALVGVHTTWMMVLSRIIFVPVIAGIGYEVIYFAGRHSDNFFARILSAPGMWLQSLTTREPDDSQIEVALVALKTVMASEEPTTTPAMASSAT